MTGSGRFWLLALATGLATYYYGTPRKDGADQLAKVTRIVTMPSAEVGGGSTGSFERPRVFSPQKPLIAPAPEPSVAATPKETVAIAAISPVGTIATPVTEPLPVVEAIQPRRAMAPSATAALPAAPPPARITPPARQIELDPEDLARELQKELKRVGCYEGEIDGDWGPGSKRAMRAFTERVNSTLPTDTPDQILITLVRGHAGALCSKACPSGQAFDGEGRCTPKAVLTQAARKKPVDSRREDMASSASARETAGSRSGSTTVALEPRFEPRQAGASMRTPQVDSGSPLAAAPPLPGRMSVGAPPAYIDGSGAAGALRPGALAALDGASGDRNDSASTLPAAAAAAAAAAIAAKRSSEPAAQPERRSAAPQRQRERAQRASPSPQRSTYSPPSRPSGQRYSSFTRPGAVHNFFFDPRRNF